MYRAIESYSNQVELIQCCVLVDRQNEILPMAAYRWVFRIAMPNHTNHASDTRLSLHHFLAADAAAHDTLTMRDRLPVFMCVEFFAVS